MTLVSTETARTRFLRAMRFEATDRLPVATWGLWPETEARWREEGAEDPAAELAIFDGPMQSCWLYGPFQGPIPPFEETVLDETDTHCDRRNALGQTLRWAKGGMSMPHFLEYPLEDRKDWEAYRKRLDPSSPGRLPEDWDEEVRLRNTERAGEIRGVAMWGFYAFPREMFGPEALSYMLYDDPGLIAEMNEFWADYSMRRLEKAIREMDFDYALIWEDSCYNHGMLHSPDHFREFMAPHYRTVTDFFRRHGIEIISVDSDGNVTDLIPLLLDVGVTAMHPFEVAAGMDVVAVGREYPDLQLWGGIDKRVLAEGPDAIDAELERVLPAMKQRGGYMAGLDHNIPSNISLEAHRYYAKRVFEMA